MKVLLKSKYITIALHVMIWGMLLLTPYFFSNAHNGYRLNDLPWTYITISDFLLIVVFYTNAFYLFPHYLNRQRYRAWLLRAVLLIASAAELKLIFQKLFYPDIPKEFTAIRFLVMPAIGIFFISSIYRIILDRIRFEREQKERQAAQLATELKFLRSQISPHFLFNVLTNLVSLARKRSDRLEPSLIMLSDLMRYMLYDTQGKKVTLGTEIEYLQNYVALQKLRFGSDVAVTSRIEIGELDRSHTIEPMLLIPFVENAFKHGVGAIEEPRIDIQLRVQREWMHFEVQNTVSRGSSPGVNGSSPGAKDGPAGSPEENSGLGLNNVRTRLQLLYRDHHTLTIRNEEKVFHIILTLKLL